MSTHHDWLHGRGQADFSPLEEALVLLHVNVIESLIANHRAAEANPVELERNSRARGNGAAGNTLEEGSVEEDASKVRTARLPMTASGAVALGVSVESAPGALSLEFK